MSPKWTIRPATEEDYPGIALTETAVGPEPVTESQIREWHRMALSDKECPSEWLVVVDQDKAPGEGFLGWGSWGKARWLSPDESQIHVAVPPANRRKGVGSHLLQHLEALTKLDSPKAIYAWGRGYDHDSIAWAQKRGYVVERRRTEGVLDLAEFDAAKFRSALDKVAAQGIEVRTLWDDQIGPYMYGLYRVAIETFRDVPFRSAGAGDTSYEAFASEIKDSRCGKVFAIAFCESEIVGYSNLWMPRTEGQSAVVDYTGVLKEHRGKGIAFAVKVAAAAEGARAGAKRIRTNNDPDNPAILHLNRKMGFHEVPGPVIFKKPFVV